MMFSTQQAKISTLDSHIYKINLEIKQYNEIEWI